jgi:hypothetical protein
MNAETTAKPRRLWLYGPFVLLGLVAAGWSALWFYGRSRINAEIDNFFARQASLGREWSCPDRSITGFPFRIEGRCANPSYRQQDAAGERINGALKGLTVVATTAGALNLGHVITEFEGPLVVKAAGVPDTTTTWKTARSSIRGGINRLERVSIEIESPVVTIGGPGGSTQWRADKVVAHLREAANPANAGAYDLFVQLDNAVVPDLDQAMNSRDPINLKLDSVILKPGRIDRRDWRQTIENWRSNGGTMRVDQLMLSKGAPRLEAKGDLKLDGERRPEGRLDASFVNAGALLQQFGIGAGGGGAAGLVGALLGGGNRQGGQPRDVALRLPLVLDNGRAAVGPFRIPGLQLRPLY